MCRLKPAWGAGLLGSACLQLRKLFPGILQALSILPRAGPRCPQRKFSLSAGGWSGSQPKLRILTMFLFFSLALTEARAAALDWSEPRLCFRLRDYTTK